MKKRILSLLLCIILVFSLFALLMACNNNVDSDYAGTYYSYKNGEKQSDDWIKLGNDSWSDSDGGSGRLEEKDGVLYCYVKLFGEEDVLFYGKVENGAFQYSFDDKTQYIYYSDDCTLENKNSVVYVNEENNENDPDFNKKTITFNTVGGNDIDPIKFEIGEVLSLPVPIKEGYEFVGWYSSSENKNYENTSVMPDYDLFLNAIWEKAVSEFKDEYVTFRSAIEGRKHSLDYRPYNSNDGISKTYIYVDLTSDDLGGSSRVGKTNNLDLSVDENLDFSVKEGYTLMWYTGNFETPNGAQVFTLEYGSNIQLITITQNQQVKKRYLVDLYVKNDYYVSLYESIDEPEPYTSVRVVENDRLPADIAVKQHADFEFDQRVYFNANLDRYVAYNYTSLVTGDFRLYQTYKPRTMTVELNGGTLNNAMTVTPYNHKANYDVPTKEGYDFIGWKLNDGTYFTDPMGFAASQVLSSNNNFEIITADFREKRFGRVETKLYEETIFSFLHTIPVVIFTDSTQKFIHSIQYFITNSEDEVVPTEIPYSNNLKEAFIGYGYYDDNKNITSLEGIKATMPLSVFPVFTELNYVSNTENINTYLVKLNDTTIIPSGESEFYLRTFFPTNDQYQIEISVTGSCKLEIQGENRKDMIIYDVSSQCPVLFYLNSLSTHGWRTILVKDRFGSLTISCNGITMESKSPAILLDDDNVIKTTDEIELNIDKGTELTWIGWFDGETKISENNQYSFIMGSENKSYIAKWEISDIFLNNLIIEGSTLKGVVDKTVKKIIIPNMVDCIDEGALNGCFELESLTIPFIGSKAVETNSDNHYPFGYIFGTSGYNGGKKTYQYYYDSSELRIKYATYYIPASLKTVVLIGGNCLRGSFYNCSDIESITFYNYMTTIEVEAFYGCSSLTNLKIPNNIKKIGENAFYGCSALTSITLPDNLKEIEKNAFYDCNSLTNVTMPKGLMSIGDSAFWGCNSLTDINIPNSVINIGNGAFSNCSNLLFINIPNSVTSIYDYTFYGCDKLKSITIPNNVKEIGYAAFSECVGLLNITIPNSVTNIGDNAFSGCNSLTSITIPNSVTSIGANAFSSCYSLISITIPDSVTSIGDKAFYYCSSLKDIAIPDSVTNIGGSMFYECKNLKYEEYDNGRYIGNENNPYVIFLKAKYNTISNCIINPNTKVINGYAFMGCKYLEAIFIPNSVTSIGNSAFSGCSKLTSITIPNSVTSIGSNAFSYCSKLTSIIIPNSVTSIGGQAFSDCSSLTSITIPNSVISIDSETFSACSNLRSVKIGTGVTSIGWCAFYNCSSLTSISIPDSVTEIGACAFQNCSSLPNITIPNSVTKIDSQAFIGCSGLKSIKWGKYEKITESSFSASNSLKNITISDNITYIGETFSKFESLQYNYYDNGKYIGDSNNPYIALIKAKNYSIESCIINPNTRIIADYAFGGCANLKSITIPDSVTSIGYYAFNGCNSLTSITIPDSVTSIRSYAFANCSSLKYTEYDDGYYLGNNNNPYLVFYCRQTTNIISCKINPNTKIICGSAFYNCSNLTNITIPDSVTSIGSNAFQNCSSLTSINIPDTITSIGGGAFSGCTSLTSITIPNSVKTIEVGTFRSCSNLRSVKMGTSVTSIGNFAFSGCTSLTSITIPDSVMRIEWSAFEECSSLKCVIFINTTSWGMSSFSKSGSLFINVTNPFVNAINIIRKGYCWWRNL